MNNDIINMGLGHNGSWSVNHVVYTSATLVVFSGEKMSKIILEMDRNKCKLNNFLMGFVNFGKCLCLSYLLLVYKGLRFNGKMIGVKKMHAHLDLCGYYCCLRRA